jgi:hypothetical protein
VRDASVTSAGYQQKPAPNQWFGGPELATDSPLFGRTISVREGNIVLRDASGIIADSVNYGGVVDPWSAEGYQGRSGSQESGCYAPSPAAGRGMSQLALGADASVGRFPDGADSDDNCADFHTQASTTLANRVNPGETNIKITGVSTFAAGQTVRIGSGAELESAVIAQAGSAGGTEAKEAATAGATSILVNNLAGFHEGQTITIDTGAKSETDTIASVRRFEGTINVKSPLTYAHATGAQVSGTGITFTSALTHAHAAGAEVTDNLPTPGAANKYTAIAQ